MSIWVIGDIHGCFDTFQSLLKKLPEGDKICLVGDLIDRGPKSRQVVQYVIDNNIDCVTGNHEVMMVEQPDYWALNGGMETLQSYSDQEEGWYGEKPHSRLNTKLFNEHKLWMDNLPTYIEYPEIKNKDGRYLVVSHSIIHNYWKKRDQVDEYKINQFNNNVTWGRSFHNVRDNPEIFNIFGHTPQEYKAKVKKIYANVDTGCCFNSIPSRLEVCPYGIMTALNYPSMEIITQKNIDNY